MTGRSWLDWILTGIVAAGLAVGLLLPSRDSNAMLENSIRRQQEAQEQAFADYLDKDEIKVVLVGIFSSATGALFIWSLGEPFLRVTSAGLLLVWIFLVVILVHPVSYTHLRAHET